MNLPEILTTLGIEYRLPGAHRHVRGQWCGLDCVRCSPKSKRFRLGIHQQYRYANCWTCGHLPNLSAILAESSGVSIKRVLALLRDWAGQPSVRRDRTRPARSTRNPDSLGPLLPAHRRYLEGRGLDPDEVARLWGAQGIGIAPRLQWRIYLPVVLHGITVSWTTRGIGEQGKRYLSASPDEEAVPLKRTVFGADYVRGAAVICEGPFDAIRIGPGAVATYGLGYSRTQLAWMASVPTRIIAFDNEDAAQRRAVELANDLAVYPGRTCVVRLTSGKDAGNAAAWEIRELRKMLEG